MIIELDYSASLNIVRFEVESVIEILKTELTFHQYKTVFVQELHETDCGQREYFVYGLSCFSR